MRWRRCIIRRKQTHWACNHCANGTFCRFKDCVALLQTGVGRCPGIFIAAAFVLAGQLYVVFIPHLGGRFAGISLVSVGTGIGEVSVFLQASKELQEVPLCSLIVGTSVGGVLGAVFM